MTRTMPAQKPGKSEQTVQTPVEFMAAVTSRFGAMSFDLAALPTNAQAPDLFTPEHDSLSQNWQRLEGNLWLNPPYGEIGRWAEKCARSAPVGQTRRKVFFLVPASVGANWWTDHVHDKARILWLSPRLRFVGHDAPYPKDLALMVYGETPGYEPWRWSNSPRRQKGGGAHDGDLAAPVRKAVAGSQAAVTDRTLRYLTGLARPTT